MDMPTWMPVTIYAGIILVYLAIYSWRHMDDSIGRQPFVLLVFFTTLMLLSDFYGRFEGTEGAHTLSIMGATIINFVLLPAVGTEWHQFIRNLLIAQERRRMRPINQLVTVVAIVGAVIALLTPVTSWVFYYDAAGLYHRGKLFIVPALTTFFIFLVTDIFLFTQVKSLERYSIRMLGAYPIPVVIGAILTYLIVDVPWMPLGFAMATLALFAHIQNTGMGRDYLTGLFNRRKLEALMAERIERSARGHYFAAIMMDVDKFKIINDTLGHTVGDLALAETAQLLRRSVRSGDAIARFGGDEFFVLLDIEDRKELDEIVASIETEERKFSAENKDYNLRLSKGYDIYDPRRFAGVKEFEEHLDKLMYADKLEHHRQLAQQQGQLGLGGVDFPKRGIDGHRESAGIV